MIYYEKAQKCEGESKILPSYSNVSHKSAHSYPFADDVKMINHIELCDDELTWYSPSVTYWICFYSLEHDHGIHSLKPNRPFLFVEVLATQVKFLQPFGYGTAINSTFAFPTANIFLFLRTCKASISDFEYMYSLISAAFESHIERRKLARNKTLQKLLMVGWLVVIYRVSTLVGYLMPNPVY